MLKIAHRVFHLIILFADDSKILHGVLQLLVEVRHSFRLDCGVSDLSCYAAVIPQYLEVTTLEADLFPLVDRRSISDNARFPLAGSILVMASAGILPCGAHLTWDPNADMVSRMMASSIAFPGSALEPLVFFDKVSETLLASTTDTVSLASAK